MAAKFRLGIQSYCFRKFQPLEKLIEALDEVGLKYVELWPGHQPFDAPEAELRRAIEAIRSAGIGIDSCGVSRMADDEQANRNLLAFGKMAGVRAVSVDFPADVSDETLRKIEALCEEYEVDIALHNHGKKHHWGPPERVEELLTRTGPRVGLCLDTAWALDSGADPLEMAERFYDRLKGVHLKDFAFDADGAHEDVIIGTGNLNLPGLLKLLSERGFAGYMSLEYEGNADAPLPDVKACVQAVEEAAKAL